MSAPDWSGLKAPTLADLEGLAATALAALPDAMARLAKDVVLRVADFPDDETLDEMSCESEFDLLGLFRGHGLAQGRGPEGVGAGTGQMPNMVWLYRRPILDYWADTDDTLGAIVTHVLIHEIGHHFGMSDADMERIERGA